MSAVGRPARERVAAAFAPSHVTGIFAPDLTPRDPRARGSVGAGLVLNVGVTAVARFRPGPRPRVVVRADATRELPISFEVARRLAAGYKGTLTVDLTHVLPIGQGFGSSAAGALATGLAITRLWHRPRSAAVETAHLADLFLGGGLGGVAAILGGGLELRTRAGVPPWGRILHAPFPYPVFVSVVGGAIPSAKLLGDPRFLARVRAAAEGGLARLAGRAEPRRFLDAAEEFTDELGLASPSLVRTIRALRSRGGRTAQAMFGHSIFVVPRNPAARRAVLRELERRGLPTLELKAGRAGAGRRPSPDRGRPTESLLPRGRVAALP